jgi:hypothetical protein
MTTKPHPKEVGERSEGQVLAAFLKAEEVVLTPFGDSQRYDFVLDRNGTFIRIQCKTGRLKNGCIHFPACSSNWNQGTTRDYRGQIEFFAVYVPDTARVYLVPVDDVGIKTGCLRIAATRNGQTKGIRLAEQYEYKGKPGITPPS